MSAPGQGAAFQREHALRFAVNRGRFRMGVIGVVGEMFVVGFGAPGIRGRIFSIPVHGALVASFVAFQRPLAGPGETFTLDVGALFRRFWRREIGWGNAMFRDYR